MTLSLKGSGRSAVREGWSGSTWERGEWVTQAKCRSGDPDALFVRGAEQRKAAVICRHCPVLKIGRAHV